jgi:hypothetical protein
MAKRDQTKYKEQRKRYNEKNREKIAAQRRVKLAQLKADPVKLAIHREKQKIQREKRKAELLSDPVKLEEAREYKRLKAAEKRARDLNKPSVIARQKEMKAIWHLKHYYNLTTECYDKLWEEQKGRCAFCGGGMKKIRGRGYMNPVIDHCHETGVVRGIVHGRCNLVIGVCENYPNIIKNIKRYLAKGKKKAECNNKLTNTSLSDIPLQPQQKT